MYMPLCSDVYQCFQKTWLIVKDIIVNKQNGIVDLLASRALGTADI